MNTWIYPSWLQLSSCARKQFRNFQESPPKPLSIEYLTLKGFWWSLPLIQWAYTGKQLNPSTIHVWAVDWWTLRRPDKRTVFGAMFKSTRTGVLYSWVNKYLLRRSLYCQQQRRSFLCLRRLPRPPLPSLWSARVHSYTAGSLELAVRGMAEKTQGHNMKHESWSAPLVLEMTVTSNNYYKIKKSLTMNHLGENLASLKLIRNRSNTLFQLAPHSAQVLLFCLRLKKRQGQMEGVVEKVMCK